MMNSFITEAGLREVSALNASSGWFWVTSWTNALMLSWGTPALSRTRCTDFGRESACTPAGANSTEAAKVKTTRSGTERITTKDRVAGGRRRGRSRAWEILGTLAGHSK